MSGHASGVESEEHPGFLSYEVPDTLGRHIRFFLSRRPNVSSEPLPVALYVQGSGCHSLFRVDHEGRFRSGPQNLLRRAAGGRLRILAVEKPGVPFLYWPGPTGTTLSCPQEFHTEHTLERWLAALRASLHTSLNDESVARDRTIVVGHSEGGLCAAALARRETRITHVVLLSSSGVNQLLELVEVQKLKAQSDRQLETQQPDDDVYAIWERIKADPNSTTDFAWGHPYRRWASFLSTSTLDELRGWRGKVLVVHGENDSTVPISSIETLVGELLKSGVDVTFRKIKGGDHGCCSGAVDCEALMSDIVEWGLS